MTVLRVLAVAVGLGAAVMLTSCAASGQSSAPIQKSATTSCNSAFDTASAAVNAHYKNDPMFGPEYDALYADGTISAEEQPRLDAMIQAEEESYAKAVDPVYDACKGVEDLYAGAYAHKDDADWALQESEAMDREKVRKIFVVSFCSGKEARPACSDFVAADWK